MYTEPLEAEERLYLRSRMVPALSLGAVLLMGSVAIGIQARHSPESRYLWWSLLAVALGLTWAVGRVGYRFYRDLKKGEKLISEEKVEARSEEVEPLWLMVKGKNRPASSEVWKGGSKGNYVELMQAPSGLFLGLRLPSKAS